jgi:hypothetical protein
LNDLAASCLAGTFTRPCTTGELQEITKTIRRVLRSKDRLGGTSSGHGAAAG